MVPYLISETEHLKRIIIHVNKMFKSCTIILLTTRFYVVIPILVSFVTEVFQVNRMMLLNLLHCATVVRATVQPGTNISSVHCVHNRGCIRLC